MKRLLIILLTFSWVQLAFAQKAVTTFGIQVKPILPISQFVDGPIEYSDSIYSGTMVSKTGYSFGMVVRHGLTQTISLETGINYIRRNYDISMSKQTGSTIQTDHGEFGFVSYGLPIKALVFIKLSDQFFMNASGGAEFNAYASPIYVISENRKFEQYAFPSKRFGASVLANIGFEYRSEKSGIFYIGASFNRPFGNMATTRSVWLNDLVQNHTHINALGGQYLTLDLRYFFHEEAVKKSKNKKKKDKSED